MTEHRMDAHNPYRTPDGEIVEAPLVHHIQSASKPRRFLNWLIDKLAMLGLMVLAAALIGVFGSDAALEWIDGMNKPTEYAIDFAMVLIYYTAMEGLFGLTIGKLITGTRVVDAEGRRLTFKRALLRSLCRLIPFDALSLLISDDDVRRAWHDSITRTYVVSKPRVEATHDQGATVSDSTTMSST
ncbi:RDD family protein [Pseudoxanthomonas sacheonensis]|uniref:RDD family membrane protein YckC n=1 Tax=Pseudoxanthomonas sacheonensis TaxID=443615 RepID=A0ABU1RUT5_9GAMM|nr:RDD family protein [Pseudoxanthomonas sacheonensis]MDR6841685.1 putative RDD family membrane protein YckC [Pseudoxanthomonas sacheonensis]